MLNNNLNYADNNINTLLNNSNNKLTNENNIICNLNDDYINEDSIKNNIINRGTGAGGSNTNKNGIPYEILTELNTEYNVISHNKYSKQIIFNNNKNKLFILTKQGQLFKYMNNYIDKNISKAHGCKNPDECFIDEISNIIFIIEKKFQQVNGSVCEKIQTPDFKIWQYNRTFPNFKIVYIYCLSDWFIENCKAEVEYMKYKNIPIFWGNSKTYKQDIVNYIINYK